MEKAGEQGEGSVTVGDMTIASLVPPRPGQVDRVALCVHETDSLVSATVSSSACSKVRTSLFSAIGWLLLSVLW